MLRRHDSQLSICDTQNSCLYVYKVAGYNKYFYVSEIVCLKVSVSQIEIDAWSSSQSYTRKTWN